VTAADLISLRKGWWDMWLEVVANAILSIIFAVHGGLLSGERMCYLTIWWKMRAKDEVYHKLILAVIL
jgi:hypothetical protein